MRYVRKRHRWRKRVERILRNSYRRRGALRRSRRSGIPRGYVGATASVPSRSVVVVTPDGRTSAILPRITNEVPSGVLAPIPRESTYLRKRRFKGTLESVRTVGKARKLAEETGLTYPAALLALSAGYVGYRGMQLYRAASGKRQRVNGSPFEMRPVPGGGYEWVYVG